MPINVNADLKNAKELCQDELVELCDSCDYYEPVCFPCDRQET